VIRSENWSRNAAVSGTMDDRDIAFSAVAARLQTTHNVIVR